MPQKVVPAAQRLNPRKGSEEVCKGGEAPSPVDPYTAWYIQFLKVFQVHSYQLSMYLHKYFTTTEYFTYIN